MSDRLKDILNGNNGPTEIVVSDYVSPVAKIKVVWVGGGWSNAVNRMIEGGLEGVDFIAINTDSQALFDSRATKRITIWNATTKGLWAGSNPEVGGRSAEESSEEIKSALEGSDMVFITCGLGWGTWTWAAPVIAEIAKELGVLTVWVVTKPFSFEGQKRMAQAVDGYNRLKEKVDTLITIPNDRILSIIDKKTPLMDAFSIVDEVLNQGVQGVSDLIVQPGLINVDFADVKSVMQDAGSALMGIGYWSGENRAVEAARSAIDSPLLELSIAWAKGVLFNITGGNDLSMFEVDEAAKIITESVDPDANIIFGTSINENYTGDIKITVVATGFDEESNQKFGQVSAASSAPAFGRRPVSQAPVTPAPAGQPMQQAESNSASTQTTTRVGENRPSGFGSSPRPASSGNDLDVPAFLRNKIR